MNQSAQIRSALTADQLPPPSTVWLQSLVASQAAAPPSARTLPALVATAKAQLLGSDWTAPGLFEGALPGLPAQLRGANAGAIQETRLPQDIIVQVLDMENLSQSRWQQVQALEAIERGEQKRGREVRGQLWAFPDLEGLVVNGREQENILPLTHTLQAFWDQFYFGLRPIVHPQDPQHRLYLQLVWLRDPDGGRIDNDWQHSRFGGGCNFRRARDGEPAEFPALQHGDVYELVTVVMRTRSMK